MIHHTVFPLRLNEKKNPVSMYKMPETPKRVKSGIIWGTEPIQRLLRHHHHSTLTSRSCVKLTNLIFNGQTPKDIQILIGILVESIVQGSFKHTRIQRTCVLGENLLANCSCKNDLARLQAGSCWCYVTLPPEATNSAMENLMRLFITSKSVHVITNVHFECMNVHLNI